MLFTNIEPQRMRRNLYQQLEDNPVVARDLVYLTSSMAKGLHKKALTQILQIMHIRAYQFPESKIQKFNAEFRIEKKKPD